MVSGFQVRLLDFLLVVLTVSLVVLTTGNIAGAAELDWILDLRAMASDNIFRESVGSEIPGTLYQLMGGLQIEDVEGYNNYRFMGVAGRERIETTLYQEEVPVYRLESDVSWTSRNGSFLQILGNASRQTNTLQPSDFNQLRTLEERLDAQILTGKRFQSGGEWQGSLIGDRLDRENLVVKRIGIAANATVPINRSNDLNFEGLARRGYGFEDFSGNEWIEGFIDMEYIYRSARNLSLGSSLYWFSAVRNSPTTNVDLELNNVRATSLFQIMEAINTPFYCELGLDGISNSEHNWDWDLYADISLSFPLAHEITMMGRRMELNVQVIYEPLVNRTNMMPVSMGRLGSFGTTIVWRPARTFEIDTGVVFATRFFPDEEQLPDRDEARRTATVGTRWLISQDTNFRVAAIWDQTDSELNTRDLDEKKIEMNFTGFF